MIDHLYLDTILDLIDTHQALPNELLPPWKVFDDPNYEEGSLGWRMGVGEEYMEIFGNWYNKLSQERKESYKKRHKNPWGLQLRGIW